MNYNSPKAVSPQGEYIHIVGNVEDYLGAKYGGMRVDGCGEKGGTMVDPLGWSHNQALSSELSIYVLLRFPRGVYVPGLVPIGWVVGEIWG